VVAKSYVIKDAWDDEITLVPRDENDPYYLESVDHIWRI
jgi:hypothetical protein